MNQIYRMLRPTRKFKVTFQSFLTLIYHTNKLKQVQEITNNKARIQKDILFLKKKEVKRILITILVLVNMSLILKIQEPTEILKARFQNSLTPIYLMNKQKQVQENIIQIIKIIKE